HAHLATLPTQSGKVQLWRTFDPEILAFEVDKALSSPNRLLVPLRNAIDAAWCEPIRQRRNRPYDLETTLRLARLSLSLRLRRRYTYSMFRLIRLAPGMVAAFLDCSDHAANEVAWGLNPLLHAASRGVPTLAQ